MRRNIVLVYGYLKHHLWEVATTAVDKDVTSLERLEEPQYGFHLYPHNDSGCQFFIASNYPLPDDIDALDIVVELDDVTEGESLVPEGERFIILKEPIKFKIKNKEFYLVADISGYSYKSISPDDEIYEP
jgi:hypothetical protein